MTFYKILHHDIQCGLLRRRYFLIPLVALIPLIEFLWLTKIYDVTGTTMDMLLYIFKGAAPVSVIPGASEKVELPVLWLFLVGACLLINMDYILNDLAANGQQIIIRCKKRLKWYLSKCIWNILSSLLYFALLLASIAVVGSLSGNKVSISITPDTLAVLFDIWGLETVSSCQAILVGIVMPCATIMALNLLEMTLCLFVKPILSFLVCIGTLVLAIYIDNSFLLGNGAMTIRNIVISPEASTIGMVLLSTIFTIIGCAILGSLRFSRMDILPRED